MRIAKGEPCAEPLGERLVFLGIDPTYGPQFRSEPHLCAKPASVTGDDGRRRCIQHDRMARGLSGKWVNS